MKKILYVCDRCDLQQETGDGSTPSDWHLLIEQFANGREERRTSRTYCEDCSPFIADIIEAFKIERRECGAINPGDNRVRGGDSCTRLIGHKYDHKSSIEAYLESARDTAFDAYMNAQEEYPGEQWAHVIAPMRRRYQEFASALNLVRCAR